MIRRDADTGRAVPPDGAATRFPAAATALEPLDILESAGRGVIALLDHAAGLARLLGELVFLQTLTYAYARWVAPPAELVAQRLRHRLVESGAAIDATASAELLHVELEEFVQLFETPTRSFGRISVHLRLSGASGAQASFTEQIAAVTPDAPGGVRALAAATDALLARIVDWIGGARAGRTADMQLRLLRAAEG